MKSNFSVTCPYCGKENDFTGDNWQDWCVDDSDFHYIDCMFCSNEMKIEVNAIYSLHAEKTEY